MSTASGQLLLPGMIPIAMNLEGRMSSLSPRCRDVLIGLLAGQSNKEIAYGLGISPRTVEVHRAQLMKRLGARNAAEAVRIACEAMLAERHAR